MINQICYTDGSCLGNPGPGGWGLIFVEEFKIIKEYSGGFNLTTNNRMEILAVINAFKLCDPNKYLIIYSDSQYVINSINKWLPGWVKKNFRGIKNPDLFKELYELILNNKHFEINWVKAHDKNKFNNYVDELARNTASKNNLPSDTGYVNV